MEERITIDVTQSHFEILNKDGLVSEMKNNIPILILGILLDSCLLGITLYLAEVANKGIVIVQAVVILHLLTLLRGIVLTYWHRSTYMQTVLSNRTLLIQVNDFKLVTSEKDYFVEIQVEPNTYTPLKVPFNAYRMFEDPSTHNKPLLYVETQLDGTYILTGISRCIDRGGDSDNETEI